MAVEAPRAGMRLTAARWDAITARWTAWTPVWTTSTGLNTPSFGNATLDCSYCRTGDLVVGRFEIIFGSSTNFGAAPTSSDNWRFSLPVTGASIQTSIGTAELLKSTDKRHTARVRMTTTGVFELELSSGAPDGLNTTADGAVGGGKGLVDSLGPWSAGAGSTTWASGYAIRGNFTYQGA
ncbi:hypothetical protein ACPESV_24390 [Streptomyces umbrinus]|uniref:hypothetical protein n=1 Tax=Streptomyces umbrinus TaxID=67370 RepID=UPI003C2E01FC